jgi:SAM-dependent methyltransferase
MLTVDYDSLDVRAGHLLLDLGCGKGRHTFEALKRGATVVAADLDETALAEVAAMAAAMLLEGQAPSEARCLCVKADATNLPFAEGTFDRVIASEVLEHIPEDAVAIGEISRVLKADGAATVSVPRFWPETICWALSRDYRTSAGGHVRIYRAPELRTRLRDAGLTPTRTGHAHALHAPYWWVKCAVGVDRDDALPARLYKRFLEWQIVTRPRPIDALEHALDPVLGKSVVVYARKNGST